MHIHSVQHLEKVCSEVVDRGGRYMGSSLTSQVFGRISVGARLSVSHICDALL